LPIIVKGPRARRRNAPVIAVGLYADINSVAAAGAFTRTALGPVGRRIIAAHCHEMVRVTGIFGELHVKAGVQFLESAGEPFIEVSTGVFAKRCGDLERAVPGAAWWDITAERHWLALLIAHFGPAFAELGDAAGLEVFMKENLAFLLQSFITGI